MNPIIFSPTIKCEQGLASYLSASLGGSASVYTGLDNADKHNPPCVIVSCRDATEVVFNTRNYRFTVDVIVKDIASDETKEDFCWIAGNVAAYFTDSVTACSNLNTYFSSSHAGLNIWQSQITDFSQNHEGDVWINTFSFAFIGALCPAS